MESPSPPFVKGGWNPSILSTPALTPVHGSHDFNAWQPFRYPMLFLHLAEFKAPRRTPESSRDLSGLRRTQTLSH
jgi:hypothetical protein